MKEILFKAKRIDNGEWVEGIPIKTHIGLFMCFDENPHYCHMYGYMEIDKIIKVDENTLCQYTGLTDKNGNKIWENDVVKKHFYTDYDACANSEEYIGKVEYLDCAWNITCTDENNNKSVYPMFMAIEFKEAEYYEVIGNIFDNPELLKGSEEE